MMKRSKPVVAALLCAALLVSCGKTGAGDRVDGTIQHLTSPELSGRLVGSDGNNAAGDWLAQQLETIGASPLVNESLLVPFSQNVPVYTVDKLTLTSADVSQTVLKPGVDYIPPASAHSFTIRGQLGKASGEGVITVVQDEVIVLELHASYFRSATLPHVAVPEQLSLTDTGYAIVAQHIGSTLVWQTQAENRQIESHNIIGVLPGADHSRAVVLGAHFDHMGSVEDLLYAGAVDNASGVATVLETATQLAGRDLPVDVVVCFWNSEDYDFLYGSRQAVPALLEQYDALCYINVDCVGLVGAGPASVTTQNGSTPLAELLQENLAQHGYAVPEDTAGEMSSDHLNFSMVSSVNICNIGPGLMAHIHQPTDTADTVDTADIALLATALAGAIQAEGAAMAATRPNAGATETDFTKERVVDGILVPPGRYDEMSREEFEEYKRAIEAQLGPDEYIVLEVEPDIHFQIGASLEQYPTAKDMAATYPLAQPVPQALGLWQLQCILVNPATGGGEPNRVQTRERATEVPTSLLAFYTRDELAICCAFDQAPSPGQEELVLQTDAYSIYNDDNAQGSYSIEVRTRTGWVRIRIGEYHADEYGVGIIPLPYSLEEVQPIADEISAALHEAV